MAALTVLVAVAWMPGPPCVSAAEPALCSDGAHTPGVNETDTDCGGNLCAARCANDRGCQRHADCAGGFCGAAKKCAKAPCEPPARSRLAPPSVRWFDDGSAGGARIVSSECPPASVTAGGGCSAPVAITLEGTPYYVVATDTAAANATEAWRGNATGQAHCQPPSVYNSCLHALKQGHSSSGIYNITFYGAQASSPQAVYCDMSHAGGGWTLVTAQQEGHWYNTNANDGARYWQSANEAGPDPYAHLYSIVGKSDKLRGPQQAWPMQLWYEDTSTSSAAYGTQQCVRGQQTHSLLQEYSGNQYGGDWQQLGFCGNAPLALTGFAVTTGSADCKLNGYIGSWRYCATQLVHYSSCGLVSGDWATVGYCAGVRHGLWLREVPPS